MVAALALADPPNPAAIAIKFGAPAAVSKENKPSGTGGYGGSYGGI